MNEDIKYTAVPSSTPSAIESDSSSVPADAVSAEPSATPEQKITALPSSTPDPLPLYDERSLNPPSVSDANLRSFASIYDSVVPVTETRDYIIFAEYGNYSDVSLYLFDDGSTVNANGTVTGTYTRYRIWSDYNGDSRYQVYSDRSASLVFPALGDIRSANVYSNVLGYRPNPYVNEYSHLRASAVSSTMNFYVLAFACLFALISGVISKCLKK